MSGITGWVDFRRDLRRCRPTVEAMTAALVCRGPDGEGVWLDTRAALGHRHLAVAGPGSAAGPFVLEREGRPVVAAVFDGALYNAPELRAALASAGERPAGRDDAETVALAYLTWGPSCVERFDGAFTFAVWDAVKEELLLGRDRLGLKPLYLYPVPDGLLFASEPKAVLAHPLAEAVLDGEGLAELLTYAGTPDHGVFRGLSKVRPAHLARFADGRLTQRRYWSLSAREHPDDLPATVRTVRELLRESTGRQAAADVPVGYLLSGGLDSSVVAGMGAAAGDQAPHTYTVTFADYGEQFTPDVIRGTSDAPYVRDMVEHLGTAEHTDIVVRTSELTDPVSRAAALRAKDLPSMLGDMNTSLYLLCRAASEHVKVAVSGETADSVFGGNVYGGEDERALFPWMTFHEKHAGQPLLGGGLFDAKMLEALRPLEYAADRCREALAEVPVPEGAGPEEVAARRSTYLQLTRWAESQLAHSERNGMAAGLEIRMPFADHRLVDYVFNVPVAMKTFDGREKSLLRAAAEGLVPESVLHRRKSPFPVSVDPAYERVLHDELARIADDPRAPAAPLLDAGRIRSRLKDTSPLAADWVARTDVEMVLTLDAWLRSYGVRLAL